MIWLCYWPLFHKIIRADCEILAPLAHAYGWVITRDKLAESAWVNILEVVSMAVVVGKSPLPMRACVG